MAAREHVPPALVAATLPKPNGELDDDQAGEESRGIDRPAVPNATLSGRSRRDDHATW